MGKLRGPAGGEGRGRLSRAATDVLDLSGAEELCSEPTPLERVRRRLAQLPPGARLEVRTPVAEHAFAVRAWSRKNAVRVLEDEPTAGGFRLLLEPEHAAGAS